jgi:plastocyanin
MRFRPFLAAAALLLVPACSSGGGGSGAAPAGPPAAIVTMQGLAFHPATVTIHRGGTVEWEFVDNGIVHNVIGDDGVHSADMGSGTFSHRYGKAGTFNYQCSIHAGMNGTVIVQ